MQPGLACDPALNTAPIPLTRWKVRPVAAAFAGIALAASFVEGNVTNTGSPFSGPWCPLRRLTGVPCPFCGSTTAFAGFGQLRPLHAFAAQPLIASLFVFVMIAALLPSSAFTQLTSRLSPMWTRLQPVTKWSIVVGVCALSWAYQAVRFDVFG